jgi:hypothetical protein
LDVGDVFSVGVESSVPERYGVSMISIDNAAVRSAWSVLSSRGGSFFYMVSNIWRLVYLWPGVVLRWCGLRVCNIATMAELARKL